MTDPLSSWHRLAGGCVLLDGFHALKHAVRFGAEVPVAVTTDRRAALVLAEELAPDVRDRLDALLTEVPEETYRSLVSRPHPTAVAALAVRPDRQDNLRALELPRSAPVVVLDQPRNLGNAGAVVRLAAGFGATGVVTTGTLDPWHPTVVRGGAGLHFATVVERLTVEELPRGPLFALDPEGEDIRGVKLPDDAVLAFGSERSGLSAQLRSRTDHLLALPMRPKVSSYNLATSVAMALYHWSAGGGASVP
ncbi:MULTISPECIES: TrmH family RNA methyltransferase [Streptomyces]|mgnify:CR=1 FL=1|uniref:TrmH family RNA methyltransferase n=1 Tax=Streptomyces thermoviolaceus subsp. thermoviolaceus TaxID=66860 RepID=A0ABX0Z1R5_STRTL|nr:TrmH family RNA methyltransferase [Streptomyces thermoviolaceus]MCM3265982.1 TrmH family RNA methyltransferase [Streptomyces thermoviolaceus]NJP17296.1 TrmH family RNA methyltransferase [Streptomyces thermoviolaceus subsp. thermoviolaceus]WTD48403.1 TrmH family RNA methyltransferase [Streptomyces thermoviolaceus]GGV72711.1 rRNA methyltransferase [Streptomyces thermoviolaceus subsp. apingens]GHA88205.1 rRNA methyltransferase [Streptomyces thermoviolaceus subsp. thermoviolaceus]